jgi:hypothetical protein
MKRVGSIFGSQFTVMPTTSVLAIVPCFKSDCSIFGEFGLVSFEDSRFFHAQRLSEDIWFKYGQLFQLCERTYFLEFKPSVEEQFRLAFHVVSFKVKFVKVSVTHEYNWDVDFLDVLEAVISTICASLASKHLEILFLTEKFVMGGEWQCQGRLPESF